MCVRAVDSKQEQVLGMAAVEKAAVGVVQAVGSLVWLGAVLIQAMPAPAYRGWGDQGF